MLSLTSCSGPKGPGCCSAPQALSVLWVRGLWQYGEGKKGRKEKGPTAVLYASSRRTCARNTLKEMPKGHKRSWMSNKCTCNKLKSRWKAGRRTYTPKWEPRDVSLQTIWNLRQFACSLWRRTRWKGLGCITTYVPYCKAAYKKKWMQCVLLSKLPFYMRSNEMYLAWWTFTWRTFWTEYFNRRGLKHTHKKALNKCYLWVLQEKNLFVFFL